MKTSKGNKYLLIGKGEDRIFSDDAVKSGGQLLIGLSDGGDGRTVSEGERGRLGKLSEGERARLRTVSGLCRRKRPGVAKRKMRGILGREK
ncbi:hypothetical protein Nepgr_005432 [Nepenthes gracilis]|uniref:Uncharacterized protein n=1 Tax=Nepenthes gracilis TaxID=150966 RepID=A0AAD3S393_NEPGR|nr:hypothetical protein Nepgr_005432 [Nepenthes gracilis]